MATADAPLRPVSNHSTAPGAIPGSPSRVVKSPKVESPRRAPKSAASSRIVALDLHTAAVLREHARHQRQERQTAGAGRRG